MRARELTRPGHISDIDAGLALVFLVITLRSELLLGRPRALINVALGISVGIEIVFSTQQAVPRSTLVRLFDLWGAHRQVVVAVGALMYRRSTQRKPHRSSLASKEVEVDKPVIMLATLLMTGSDFEQLTY